MMLYKKIKNNSRSFQITSNCFIGDENRTCKLVRGDLNIFLLTEYSNENMIVVSLEIDNPQYWYTPVYIAQGIEAPASSLGKLAKATKVKGQASNCVQ